MQVLHPTPLRKKTTKTKRKTKKNKKNTKNPKKTHEKSPPPEKKWNDNLAKMVCFVHRPSITKGIIVNFSLQ